MSSLRQRPAVSVAALRDPDRVLALAVGVALCLAPLPALAAPADASEAEASQVTTPHTERPAEAEAEAVELAAPAEGEPGEGGGEASLQPTVAEVDRGPAPSGGGVAGAIVDPDDPNAGRAQSDLEGESLDQDIAGVPDRLPKLQSAGWWTTFGAVALGTTGGVLAGVAEVRQDEAERMAYSFDLETGQAQLYGPVADEYEQLLDEGVLYQGLARGFLIAGGVTLIAGIALFAVDARQRKRAGEGEDEPGEASARVRVEAGAGGLSLRF